MPPPDRRGRPAKPMPRDEPWLAAAGGAVLGVVAGLLLGVLAGIVAAVHTGHLAWLGKCAAVGALLGGVGGAFHIEAAVTILEAFAHFLFGFAYGETEDAESPLAPRWLRHLFRAGALCAVALWLWSRFGGWS